MKNHPLLFVAGLIALLCLIFKPAVAQELPGIKDTLYSQVLQEQRIIRVILPKDYKAGSDEKYDVLYLLDGDWHTNIASQIHAYLEQEGYVPPTIIVSVFNVDRNRDFLPTRMTQNPTSGGADNFLSFLKEELIPYVNKTYPSNGENTLYGASFGGVFSMYAFLKDPHLFDSYLASDPSFWWDGGYLPRLAAEKLPTIQGSNKTFYISGREGHDYKGMFIATMDSVFKANAPVGLKYEFHAYAGETHSSVNFKTIYDGLKFSYAGYNMKNIDFHPMNGIVLKDKPIKVWCFSDVSAVRYTTDGTEPSENSAKMENEITLAGPAALTMRSFSTRRRYAKVSTGIFREGKALAAGSKPRKAVAGGLKYTYYEGSWDSLPDFKKLKPVQRGYMDKDFNLQKLPRENDFAILLEGHIEIQEEGYYIFGLDSDDGSRLYLGDQLLINHDGLHSKGNAKSYIVPLKKGFYPLRMEYFQKDGGRGFDLIYVTPNNLQPQPIPLEVQYSRK